MAEESKIKEFPDIGSKLTAPTKKSVFERQKAEAEAKRQREQEETAAVYEDFVKSFDDADDTQPPNSSNVKNGPGFGGVGAGGFGGPSKRHFSGPSTGPATRGEYGGGRGSSGPGSLGPPPPSISRKRAYDGSQAPQRDRSQGLFAFEDSSPGPADAKSAFRMSDDGNDMVQTRALERAAPKPTLRLSSLPPMTSPAVIKSILPSNLNVEGVRILPPLGPGITERRSLSAVVTLAKDTPAIEIDTAVSALQNRYMGRGFYLSLSRYLSSAAIGQDIPQVGLSSTISSLPFGARPIPAGPGANYSRVQPSNTHRGGYAPPQSFAPMAAQHGRGAPQVQVNVYPPSDLKQLKLIHKTLEALLTHGPEFEALLMSRRDVQMDEMWAWIWNSRSVGGVWYRWRLWDVLTGAQRRKRNSASSLQRFFEGEAAWAAPEKRLLFEYTTHIEEFVSDSDYNSSDDEESGDEGRRRYQHHHGGAPPPDPTNIDGEEQAYLNPLEKAKLTHLLARLPITNAKLRRGDVARITAFAIQHAGEGAEEVVQMITSNVLKPYAFTGANSDRKVLADETAMKDDEEGNEEIKKAAAEKEDTSSSKLIGLYMISDILSSSSTSGVRHAWRYRQLFEAALKARKVFENLGRLEKVMSWGRLRAEKWKRSVGGVLTLWEGWCVFPQASQEHFSTVFADPPLTTSEKEANTAAEKASAAAMAAKSRWKTVDEKAREKEAVIAEDDRARPPDAKDLMDVDVDGEPMVEDAEDLDGEPMEDDEDIDGEPMVDPDDEDLDDRPMHKDRPDSPTREGRTEINTESNRETPEAGQDPDVGFKILGKAASNDTSKDALLATRRKRPKAEDMFADSDGE